MAALRSRTSLSFLFPLFPLALACACRTETAPGPRPLDATSATRTAPSAERGLALRSKT
jgi:hypothetical protein